MWVLMTGDPARPHAQYCRDVRPGSLPDYPFRRAAHDRLAERRSDVEFLGDAWGNPKSRVLVVRDGHLATNEQAGALRLLAPEESPAGDHLLLGSADGVVYFVVVPEPDSLEPRDPGNYEPPDGSSTRELPDGRFAGLRQLATRLDEVSASLAVHAVALAGWHQRHPQCAQCGHLTDVAEAGAFRRCPACGATHFPRTDPAVIMLVTDEQDRCLLGHNGARSAGWFSTLAGFVEPGETPEQAVAREVYEEVGIEVGTLNYAGSQPWPFPSSLMLGYFAAATSTDIKVDGEEITEARWFSRSELAHAVSAGRVGLPTTLSIAGALVTAWYGAPLPANRVT
jgi:NAD+ diphosphatase